MSKYTPGPWAVKYHGGTDTRTVHVAGRAWESWAVCEIGHSTEDEHNARLIAAAPDLLAALSRLLDRAAHKLDTSATHDGLENINAVVAARAAIAKATGGE